MVVIYECVRRSRVGPPNMLIVQTWRPQRFLKDLFFGKSSPANIRLALTVSTQTIFTKCDIGTTIIMATSSGEFSLDESLGNLSTLLSRAILLYHPLAV